MKFEVGKHYKAIHGSKWTVVSIEENGMFKAKSSDNVPYPFEPDGNIQREDHSEPHPYDLIEVWVEPPKTKKKQGGV